MQTTEAELYVELRKEAFEKQIPGIHYLDDKQLYEDTGLEEYPVERYKL